MIERESFWSKAANTTVRREEYQQQQHGLALSRKGKRARQKRENCAKAGKTFQSAHFPVGVIETKNHPSKLYLNLKLIRSANRSVWQNSIILYFVDGIFVLCVIEKYFDCKKGFRR